MSINHRAEAEKHLANAARHLTEVPADMRIAEVSAWIGQGHAALVRNEEQAVRTADLREALYSLRCRLNDTRTLVAAHIADGLASREKDRWQAAIDLSKALDEAHCNVDDLVDDRLEEAGWDPRSAYQAPASAVRQADPWAPTPDVTAEVPEPVRLVLADRLARALLGDGSGQSVARTIAFALKNEGADLTGDIEKRITELTLGPDPSDPPF
jgi:hypothetical protein